MRGTASRSPPLAPERVFVLESESVMVPTPELASSSTSAAMITPGERYPVDREVLVSLCEELLDHRRLLARLGGDLRASLLTHAGQRLRSRQHRDAHRRRHAEGRGRPVE